MSPSRRGPGAGRQLALILLIVMVFLWNAALLVYFRYREFRNDVEQRASLFATLAVKPICDGYQAYYHSGYFKFRELMNNVMAAEPDITRFILVDTHGNIEFDSDRLKNSHFIPPAQQQTTALTDPFYLDAVRRLDISRRTVTDNRGQRMLELVSPYVEEWGRHNASVIMTFSYSRIAPGLLAVMIRIAALTLVGVLVSSFVAWILCGRVARTQDESAANTSRNM